jgi:hypothetical protein
MELTETRKKRLAAVGVLGSAAFLVYMLSGSGPVGPPYRDDFLTRGPQPLMLVDQPAVRREIGLTEEQAEQIHAAVENQRPRRRPGQGPSTAPRVARMGRKHQEAFVAHVLRPEQMRRLRQIILQQQGGLALADRQTAGELGLTEAQRTEVDAILTKLSARLNESFGAGRGRQGWQEMSESRQAAAAELLELLTPEQQVRWKELLGKPFTGKIRFGPPGRRRGRPGGRPPGNAGPAPPPAP